jgi:ribosomal protein S18 acetylase RimI-like enzyme
VLYDLFVTPSQRRTGAGQQLMLAAEVLAKKQGVARLDLTTAKTNLVAQALYESLGWQQDKVFFAYNKTV